MYICVCDFRICALIILYFREHSKNFRTEDMQAQIEGKNCIVTGANSGIGYATAEGLASRCLFLIRTFEISHSISSLLRSCLSWYHSSSNFFFVFLQWSNGLYGMQKQGEGRGCTFKDSVSNGKQKCPFGGIRFAYPIDVNIFARLDSDLYHHPFSGSWQVCDLSSISDIKSFASRFCVKNEPVHILVNFSFFS